MDSPTTASATPGVTVTITAEDMARLAKRRINESALPAAVTAVGEKAATLIDANRDVLVQHIREAYTEWAATNEGTDKEFKFTFALGCAIIPRGEEAEIAVTLKHSVKYTASDAATVNANGDTAATQE